LWCARFFKTRSAAAEAVKGGHVRVNGQRVKAAREIRIGDVLLVDRDDVEYEVTVAAMPVRRGPAPEARLCYVESETSIEGRRAAADRRAVERAVGQPPTTGRPDKRTRRLMRAKRPS
jgi:ribosome-associated heat shock protein Hsp15